MKDEACITHTYIEWYTTGCALRSKIEWATSELKKTFWRNKQTERGREKLLLGTQIPMQNRKEEQSLYEFAKWKQKISKYYLLFMNTLQMLCIREWKWSEKNRHVYTHIYRIKLIYLPFLWGIYSSHNNFSLFQHEIFIITSLERCFIFFLLYICLPLYFLRFIVFIFRRFFPSS